MHRSKSVFLTSVLASFILLFFSNVQAQLPDGTRLTIGANSFFELPTTGTGAVPLIEGNDGLVLGDVVPALPGSFHPDLPDGNPDELGGIVQSFTVFTSTGTFWTELPIADLGGGLVNMSGWRAAWGDVPIVTFDNPSGSLVVTGNTYALDYAANVTDGPFAGLSFTLHLEGDVILPDSVLPAGTRLTIGGNSYFQIPDVGSAPVPLAEGNDGLVLGDVVSALSGSFHTGSLDGNLGELGGIVQSYVFFGSTGTFWTEFPIVDLGGGQVDMHGWRAAWSDSPFLSFDNPTGAFVVTGNTYALDYAANVTDGPFAGLSFTLHLEGDVILPDSVLPAGTRLTIGGNSYFQIPDVGSAPVPLAEGNDGLVLGDVVSALSGSFHTGSLDGNLGELGGIVQSYVFFGSTGTFWTEFPIVDLGGGQVDMHGWRAAWSDSPFLSFDNPTGALVVTGNTYVLDYQGLVNEDIFFGLPFILHLEGEVELPVDSDADGVPDAIDNCILAPNGPLIPDAGGNSQRDTDGDGYGNLCDADFAPQPQGDGFVDFADLTQFSNVFFTANADADHNGDGFVDFADLTLFSNMFFQAPGPSCCGIPLP